MKADRARDNAKQSTFQVDKHSGQLVRQLKSADNSNEKTVSIQGFYEGGANLVKAIKAYYIPVGRTRTGSSAAHALAREYEALFDFMKSREDLSDQWEAYREYINLVMLQDINDRGHTCRVAHFDEGRFRDIAWNQLRLENKRPQPPVSHSSNSHHSHASTSSL